MKTSMSCLLKTLLAIFAFSLFCFPSSAKDVVYVRSGADGDGSSWTNAFGNLQQAVDSAEKKGADVWVAKGVYKKTENNNYVVRIRPGVSLFGGFAGNETSLAERDTSINQTILDGDHQVMVIYSPDLFDKSQSLVVDGFTIQNGDQGVFSYSKITINNCILKNNKTSYHYVIYVKESMIKNTKLINNFGSVTLEGNCEIDSCLIKNNVAPGYVFIDYDGSHITNCEFEGNVSNIRNGIYFHNSKILNCKFINSIEGGGSIFLDGPCEFKNNLFKGNTNSEVYGHDNYLNIENCQFVSNSSVRYLLDIYGKFDRCQIKDNIVYSYNLLYFRGGELSNSLICDNVSTSDSLAYMSENLIYFENGKMINCTVVNNRSLKSTLNISDYAYDNNFDPIINSIVWGNKVEGEEFSQVDGYIGFFNCASDEDLQGDSNIKLESSNNGSDTTKNYVCFVNPAGGDYRLHSTSSCIDKGIDSLAKAEKDINGGVRIFGKAVDLGAIEYDGEYVEMPSSDENESQDETITNIDAVDNEEFVFTHQNFVYVKSSKSGSFDIYDVLSRMVAKDVHYGVGVSRVATLPKGVYIINGNKVIVQ